VAASSLTLDRDEKGSLYARARVADYWIVNLVDRVIEVYRDPGPDPSASYGWTYRWIQKLRAGEHVTPLAVPTSHIAVVDLLP
jgi:Uma2 family endonuclease